MWSWQIRYTGETGPSSSQYAADTEDEARVALDMARGRAAMGRMTLDPWRYTAERVATVSATPFLRITVTVPEQW